MEGIINVLKPPGMTSHDVISFLRRTLGEKRIGHSGTLDPQAAGVLPVCVGQATRLAEYISLGRKSYFCELTLGKATDTQDAWGAVLDQRPIPQLELRQIKEVAQQLTGEMNQQVPAYSAVKVAGQPLYKAARRGEHIDPIYRRVNIHALKIYAYQANKIRFWVECSKGTYVRALCQDFGEALGTTAYMSFLLRTSVSGFVLQDSRTLEEITAKGADLLLPKEKGIASLPKVIVSQEQAAGLFHGQAVVLYSDQPEYSELKSLEGKQDVACLTSDSKLAAIAYWLAQPAAQNKLGELKPHKVFKS